MYGAVYLICLQFVHAWDWSMKPSDRGFDLHMCFALKGLACEGQELLDCFRRQIQVFDALPRLLPNVKAGSNRDPAVAGYFTAKEWDISVEALTAFPTSQKTKLNLCGK